jgi:hypothetical protein
MMAGRKERGTWPLTIDCQGEWRIWGRETVNTHYLFVLAILDRIPFEAFIGFGLEIVHQWLFFSVRRCQSNDLTLSHNGECLLT